MWTIGTKDKTLSTGSSVSLPIMSMATKKNASMIEFTVLQTREVHV